MFTSLFLNAQIVTECVTNFDSPEDLVELIVGSGVEFSNVTYRGYGCSAGTFEGSFERGFDSGFVMATDGLFSITPSGLAGHYRNSGVEADLSKQLDMIGAPSTNLFNVITLEFDFIPKSNHLQFDYIFASNEYSSFTCSRYNDIFGFFLSGPGIDGPFENRAKNIALVPNPLDPSLFTNTPVIINSINSGIPSHFDSSLCDSVDLNWRMYSKFYVDNSSQNSISFLGHTTPLSSKVKLIPCETYHIKIAIADCGDGMLNSAVFMKENSFNVSSNMSYSISSNMTDLLDTLWEYPNHLYEGCGNASIRFNRTDATKEPISHKISVSGTADNHLDFKFINISEGRVVIPEDDSSSTVMIAVLNDSIEEGVEEFTVKIYPFTDDCYECFYDSVTFKIYDQPNLNVSSTKDTVIDCPGDTVNLSANATGGIAGLFASREELISYDYHWLGEGVGPNQMVSTHEPKTYYVRVRDLCNQSLLDSTFIDISPSRELELNTETSIICSYDKEILCVNVLSGNGEYTYKWPNGISDSCIRVFPGIYPVEVQDKCGYIDTTYAQLIVDSLPESSFVISEIIPDSLGVRLINLTPKLKGYQYIWDFGDASGSDEYQPHTYYFEKSGDYYIHLNVIKSTSSCYEESGQWVRVAPSYQFYAPKSFTPNGDGLNDTFNPYVIGHEDYELYIFDRWGRQVFYSSRLDLVWDGTSGSKPLNAGLYVYVAYVSEYLTGNRFKESGTINIFR